jgi:5-formyltetrahydrofolate cyclo-ligase
MNYKRNRMMFYDCDKHSLRIARTLYELPEWKSAGAVNIYKSMGNEVSTKEIIGDATHVSNKVVYHPAGKPEYNSSDIDLVIVPGVVFDVKMARYGRGLGYYDRFLSRLDEKIKIIALAYDFQVSKKELKLDDWDIKMDYIITEKRVIQKQGYYFTQYS